MISVCGVGGEVMRTYGMRCIAASHGPKLTVCVGHKRAGRGEAMRSESSNSGAATLNQQHLQGVCRLLNPLHREPEFVAREKDGGERDYVGRWLHVADEALHSVKRDAPHRKRRRVH